MVELISWVIIAGMVAALVVLSFWASRWACSAVGADKLLAIGLATFGWALTVLVVRRVWRHV